MKRFLALALVAGSAQAYEPFIQSQPLDDYGMFNYSAPYSGGEHWNYWQYQMRRPGNSYSLPNVFGGEDFYNNRGYMGRSMPNIFGGRDFYTP